MQPARQYMLSNATSLSEFQKNDDENIDKIKE